MKFKNKIPAGITAKFQDNKNEDDQFIVMAPDFNTLKRIMERLGETVDESKTKLCVLQKADSSDL